MQKEIPTTKEAYVNLKNVINKKKIDRDLIVFICTFFFVLLVRSYKNDDDNDNAKIAVSGFF